MKLSKVPKFLTFFAVCLLLAILISCSGCVSHQSSSSRFMHVAHQDSHGFSASYKRLSGKETYSLTVKEDSPLNLHVKTTTEDGSLKITVGQTGKAPVYEGNENSPAKEFTINLKEPGKYKIVLEASKHKGSYSFSW